MVQPSPFASASCIMLCLVLAGPAGSFPNPFSHVTKPAPPAATTTAPAAAITARPDDEPMRIGVLANGLRYAIVRSGGAGQASLRLRFNVGANEEGPDEQGFTQVLARLPFDHPKIALKSRGSAPGPDLKFNADDNVDATFDATTFSLDFPVADPGSVDTAIGLMRGVVGEPKFSQTDADAEWNVVLAHERGNNDVAYRLFKARVAFLLEGQQPALGYVAGKSILPTTIKRAAVEAFHARYYRPETALLVVTGDIDPDQVEARIRARFGDWRDSGPAGAAPAPGTIESRGAQTRLFVEDGAPSTIQLSWVSPPDHSPDNPTRQKSEAIERLALAILNHRLSDKTGDGLPFESAAALRAEQFGVARVTSLIIGTTPDHWRTALSTADQLERSAVNWGATADELAQARGSVEEELTEAANDAGDRSSSTVADALATSLGVGLSPASPTQALSQFDQETADVTPEQVSAAIKGLFGGQGPLLFMSSPAQIEGGEAALANALAAAESLTLTPPKQVAAAPAAAPLSAFGEIGRQADRQDVIDLDTVFIRFENGVRLTIKPTKFRADEVAVKVRIGGVSTMPDWALASLADGLAANITGEADAIDLSTSSTRDDLEDTLRLLAGPIVSPAWNTESLEKARKLARERFDHDGASADGVLARDLPDLLSGRQPWVTPDHAQIDGITIANLKRSVGPILASGPVEVIIVGDITVDKAVDAVAATFAALPARPAPAAGVDSVPPAPFTNLSVVPVTDSHAGRADDAKAMIAWLTDNLLADQHEPRTLQVLAAALQNRLNGAGLPANAQNSPRLAGSAWDYFTLTLGGDPGAMPALFNQAERTVADLRTHDIGEDELMRAKASVELGEETRRKTNAHWLDLLSGAQEDSRRLLVIRSQEAAVDRVSAADIRAAAERYLRDDAALKVIVKPAAS